MVMTSDSLALLAKPVCTVLCPLCSLSRELHLAAANGGACAWQEGSLEQLGQHSYPHQVCSVATEPADAPPEFGLL